jgi:hypothetical protein
MYVLTPQYVTARSQLLVSSQPPRVLFDTHETETDYRTYQLTQVSLVKSYKVLDAALKMPGITKLSLIQEQADPVEWLVREIKVDVPRGAELLQISLSGTREKAEEITKIVNAVTDAYQQETVDEVNSMRRKRLVELTNLYEDRQLKLEELRMELRALARAVGSDDKATLTYKQQLAFAQLDSIKSELLKTRMELSKLNAEIHVAKEIRKEGEEAAKKGKEAAKQVGVGDRAGTDTHLGQLEVKKRVLSEFERKLSMELRELSEELGSLNKGTLDLEGKKAAIALQDDSAKAIGRELEVLKVELKATPRIRLIDKARVTKPPDGFASALTWIGSWLKGS